MKRVTDPALVRELNGGAKKVTDPALLAELEGRPAAPPVPPDLRSMFMPGNEANARNFRMAAGNPMAEVGANQDPVATAKMVPPALGLMGAVSPIPGGATLGTVGGRQLSNAMLRTIGKSGEIPSVLSQIGEGALSAAGDIGAIPFMKKAYFGKQIGAAESAAGLNTVAKEAPPSGARTAVKFIQGLRGKDFSPEEAKRIKPAIDWIFSKGWLKGSQFEPEAVEVSQAVQRGINRVPGRAAPASAMARAMTIPRQINSVYQKIPSSVRRGIGYGTGVGLAGGASFELIKKLMGE